MAETCLVTGATGFVGSAVARALLRDGHHVRALVRAKSDRRNLDGLPLELAEGDLTDAPSLARAAQGCTALFHVAADYRLWTRDPAAMIRANVDGTVAMLRAAGHAGVKRVVYTSSVATLGIAPKGQVADETTPSSAADMIGPYKSSKYEAERRVDALVADGLPVVIVNPSTPIGPRDIKPTPTGRIVVEAANGGIPAFVDTGLNIAHVDDVAQGHLDAFAHGKVGERYIFGGDDMTLAAILAEVARLTGRKPPTIRLSRRLVWPVALVSEMVAQVTGKEPLATRDGLRMAAKTMFFSSAKAERELGYRHRSAAEALADAVAWFRQAGMVR